MTSPDPSAAARRSAYLVLTVVAVSICVAKIVGAENVFEPSRYRPPAPTGFGIFPSHPIPCRLRVSTASGFTAVPTSWAVQRASGSWFRAFSRRT